MAAPAQTRTMTPEEYERWRAAQLESYPRALAEAGVLTLDAARERAAEQFGALMPDGQATPHMHVVHVLDDAGSVVGALWVGPSPSRPTAGFVWDVEIDEAHRGAGHGRRAMLAAEAICRSEGWTELELNVFGHNATARALYDSLGFRAVSTAMSKRLD